MSVVRSGVSSLLERFEEGPEGCPHQRKIRCISVKMHDKLSMPDFVVILLSDMFLCFLVFLYLVFLFVAFCFH